MRLKSILATLAAVGACSALLTGCGAGGGNNGGQNPAGSTSTTITAPITRSTMSVKMAWPARTNKTRAVTKTRAIFESAYSILFTLRPKNGIEITKPTYRPDGDGAVETTTTFDDVPIGEALLSAVVYGMDGNELGRTTEQPVQVVAGQNTAINLVISETPPPDGQGSITVTLTEQTITTPVMPGGGNPVSTSDPVEHQTRIVVFYSPDLAAYQRGMSVEIKTKITSPDETTPAVGIKAQFVAEWRNRDTGEMVSQNIGEALTGADGVSTIPYTVPSDPQITDMAIRVITEGKPVDTTDGWQPHQVPQDFHIL